MNDLLVEHFKDIMNLQYTGQDGAANSTEVEERREDFQVHCEELLREFYGGFSRELEEAEKKLPKLEVRDEPTDDFCPNCARPMVIKTGRFGRFISCTGYPECKTTKPILKDTGADLHPKDGGKVVERRSKRGTHLLRLRQLPGLRLRLVGPRGSRSGARSATRTLSPRAARRGAVSERMCSRPRARPTT